MTIFLYVSSVQRQSEPPAGSVYLCLRYRWVKEGQNDNVLGFGLCEHSQAPPALCICVWNRRIVAHSCIDVSAFCLRASRGNLNLRLRYVRTLGRTFYSVKKSLSCFFPSHQDTAGLYEAISRSRLWNTAQKPTPCSFPSSCPVWWRKAVPLSC